MVTKTIRFKVDGVVHTAQYPSYYDVNRSIYSRLLVSDCVQSLWRKQPMKTADFPINVTLLSDGDQELETYVVDVDDVIYHIAPMENK